MKRVLVLSVGGSPEPVVSAIRGWKPDFVYFLCSTGDEGSDRTIEQGVQVPFQVECPTCKKKVSGAKKIEPIALKAGLVSENFSIETTSDPDSIRATLQACERISVDMRRRFDGQDLEVVANYTGGTKTMSVTVVTFALKNEWGIQVNATGKGRTDVVKITAGDFPILQDVTLIRLDDAIANAKGYASRGDYSVAFDMVTAALMKAAMPGTDMSPILLLRDEYEMMALWDRFDHEGALAVAKRDKALEALHAEALKRRIRACKLLAGSDAWGSRDVGGTELVVDLVENGERCARRGRYDDAFGRLYRGTELLAQVRLRREHQVSTGNVALEKVPELSRDWLEKRRSGEGKLIQISMFESYKLLQEWSDPLGGYFAKTRATLERIIVNRNNSLFAHGLTPVSEEMWEKDGLAWRDWLNQALAIVAGPSAA